MLDSIASMRASRFSAMNSEHSASIESGTRRSSSRLVTAATAITIASTRVHGRRLGAHDRQQQDARARPPRRSGRSRARARDDADAARGDVQRRDRVAAELEAERGAEHEQQDQPDDVVERVVEACGALVLGPAGAGDAAHTVRLVQMAGARSAQGRVATNTIARAAGEAVAKTASLAFYVVLARELGSEATAPSCSRSRSPGRC